MGRGWYDNEDAGDCSMMNAADASEFYDDDEDDLLVCPNCGARTDGCYDECDACGCRLDDE